MNRAAMSSAVFLFALVASTSAMAKASISSLNQPELPCPGSAIEAGNSAAIEPGLLVAPAAVPAPVKITQRTTRNRWKALLPGSLKASS